MGPRENIHTFFPSHLISGRFLVVSSVSSGNGSGSWNERTLERARFCGFLELFLKVRISTVNMKMQDMERLTSAFATRGKGTVQNIDRW